MQQRLHISLLKVRLVPSKKEVTCYRCEREPGTVQGFTKFKDGRTKDICLCRKCADSVGKIPWFQSLGFGVSKEETSDGRTKTSMDYDYMNYSHRKR